VGLFDFIPGYHGVIVEQGKEPLFLLLLAFLIAFAATRGYTRLARTRGWGSASVSGVHMHHVVVGIVFVLVGGVIVYSQAGTGGWVRGVTAIVFGVGAALVLDEFALVFYLRDVYWANEGRGSVDAAILGVLIAGLMLVVSEPFGLSDSSTRHSGRFAFAFALIANALLVVITFLKAKRFAGTAAIAFPVIGLVGTMRLAKPGSPWARWFYGPEKLARAHFRASKGIGARLEHRLVTLVGGEPSPS
jgi:hypothetical protein